LEEEGDFDNLPEVQMESLAEEHIPEGKDATGNSLRITHVRTLNNWWMCLKAEVHLLQAHVSASLSV
jgi:hypothetical protein